MSGTMCLVSSSQDADCPTCPYPSRCVNGWLVNPEEESADLLFRGCAHEIPIGERCPACAAEDFEARHARHQGRLVPERDLIHEAREALERRDLWIDWRHAHALFALIDEQLAEIRRLARMPRICPECAARIREALERAEDEMPEAERLGER